jgi:hypothetical protein
MRDQLTVRDWLKALGTLCAGSLSTRDAQAKLAAYVPMLAHEFRPEAFTPASLTAVARACKFFPSFGELCDALKAWWEDNRPFEPTVPLLTGPKPDIPKPRAPATEAERAYVGGIVRAFAAERRHYQPSRDLPQAGIQPKPVSAGVLLASYEKLAAEGDKAAKLRLEMLRRSIAATQENIP